MENSSKLRNEEGQLKLPRLVSDGMVLQRDAAVRMWGWASPGEEVTISFLGKQYKTLADRHGNWETYLDNLKAGGPYQMEIKASTSITLKDILVGEVWVCSGQSNIELQMERVKDQYPEDMVNCDYPEIRHFSAILRYDFNKPYEDFSQGGWEAARPETIRNFSAVGYFFAKAIHKKYGIPVGFIKAAIGGSPIEAWISEEALRTYPHILEKLAPYKDDSYVNKVLAENEKNMNTWYGNLNKADLGLTSESAPWYSEKLNTDDWQVMKLPANFEKEGLNNFNGVVWFRKEIDVPEEMLNKPARLWLGRIVDSDKAYVNGQFVGEITYQYPPRKYDIPQGLLRKGKNIVAVRVTSNNGTGEFIDDKPYKLFTKDCTLDLRGEWKYKVGAVCGPQPETTFVQWEPVGLYNGMLAPVTKYTVKGALWYQGEASTLRANEYFSLMKTMISDWRKKWNQEKFPVIAVQLPNYGIADEQPGESDWAQLREAQLDSMSIPDTGLVVTIDLGEWNDLHPLRKKEVGERLALAAQKVAYGENIVASGPIYKGIMIKGNRIIINFTSTGNGLKTRDGKELKHFAVAGKDKKFVWAKAEIVGDTVEVWSEEVPEPKAVRYAWAYNPESANLINAEGLPASPFRTDRLY